MNYNTAGCYDRCVDIYGHCALYGCQKMKQSDYPGAGTGTYTLYHNNPPHHGCICPPGANKECENQYCPRKALPVSAHFEVKK